MSNNSAISPTDILSTFDYTTLEVYKVYNFMRPTYGLMADSFF